MKTEETMKAKVVTVSRRAGHLVRDEKGGGHILVNGAQDETALPGDTGTLTFTNGGPTGGYWKFTKDKKVEA